MPRALFLDLFDTLVDIHMDRLPLVEIAGRKVPSTYGLLHAQSVQWHALDFERFARELSESDRELRDAYQDAGRELPTLERFRAFGRRIGRPDEDMARTLTDAHMAEIRRHVTHHPHHPDVLARLRARGVRLAVCSNFSHSETALAVLADAKLLPLFDQVVVSDEVGLRKPRPEIFRAALERVGVSAQEAIHVGDNLEADVAGAAALGLRTVWLTRRVPDASAALAKHSGAPPTHTIADLSELENVLDVAAGR